MSVMPSKTTAVNQLHQNQFKTALGRELKMLLNAIAEVPGIEGFGWPESYG